jgi:hypothetical protein
MRWCVWLIPLVAMPGSFDASAAPVAGDPAQALRVEWHTEDVWVLRYEAAAFPVTVLSVDSLPYLLFSGNDGIDRTGAPQLPSLPVTLGIPVGAMVEASIAEPRYESAMGQHVAPVPTYELNDDREAVASYIPNATVYSQNRLYPEREIIVGEPYTLRNQYLCTIRLFPLRFNTATGELRRLVSGTLTLRIRSRSGTLPDLTSPARPDMHFEPVYRSLLLNYEQAKQWRIPNADASPPDSSGDWFTTGKDYLRIPIGRDGWHTLSPADIAAAGLTLPDPAYAQMFFRGTEIPLLTGPDSSIGFFARRHYGDSTYFDFYSDTSAYWLTRGTDPGKRYMDVPSVGTGQTVKIRSSTETMHAEKNTDYYEGTGEAEITQNGGVPGEGWVWDYFYPNTVSSYEFFLDSLDEGAGSSGALRVRLFSTTLNYAAIDHHAKFWINDISVGDLMFEGRTEGLFTAGLPAGLLRSGANSLRIQSVPTPSTPNQFYLDWFEVDYRKILRAVDNVLVFRIPAGQGRVRFTVSGFTELPVTVLDLTTGRHLTNGIATGDSATGFSVTVDDTAAFGERTYCAFSRSGELAVPTVTRKQFTDIRLSADGADYVIITHRNFRPAAEQLASHRQVAHGVRTAVIDVQDIYDEFNYGTLSAVPIKSFLQYAMKNWPSPSPAYLLFMGDASWDLHRYLPTTTKQNFVPAYGVPAGDNWFVSFDSVNTFLPSMFVGRIPASDPVQAQRTVNKIIAYENVPPDDWLKKFLFITGGGESEQPSFKSLSDALINGFVVPPPVGGSPLRVFKSSPGVIDGENKQLLRDLVKSGLLFMNFLGHSGGAVWDVSIGDPNELENTNGWLPFVTSVSCNVGAFAEPSRSVLSEEFLMADNRGACGVWASSSLGYANLGTELVRHFLEAVAVDSLRELGLLTTLARLRLWQVSPGSSQRIAMVNLNPLLGDPLMTLALPLKPDLVVRPTDIGVRSVIPTPRDSVLVLEARIRNWGLVPSDSVEISLRDMYQGENIPLGGTVKLPPTAYHDSLTFPWDASYQIGKHTVRVTLNESGRIDEVSTLNNTASSDIYVFANTLAAVKPLKDMVVPPGRQTLTVTSPIGRDSAGFRYFFQIDTVETFDSPAFDSSGAIVPGIVSGEWSTASLNHDRVYFWRARTQEGDLVGNWVTSSFVVSSSRFGEPVARIMQKYRRQFATSSLVQAVATDSGVTIAPSTPVTIVARSLGYRADANQEYYSIIRVNQQTITGYWWAVGSSFMAIRLNDFSGEYLFRSFDVAGQAAQADSMTNFIRATPAGNYLAFSVVFDGRTNVSESLSVALESLGSTRIRSIQPGQSWAFIGRKGNPAEALEAVSGDSAVVVRQIPNYYRFGSGSMISAPISIPSTWHRLRWESSGASPTGVQFAVLGMRTNGMIDTLGVLPQHQNDVDLGFLNTLTADSTYADVRFSARLSSTDPLVTPLLREWSVGLSPSGDLAVSARSVGPPGTFSIRKGEPFDFPVTVSNIGYQAVDGARVTVSLYDRYNKARPIAFGTLDTIPAGGAQGVTFPLSTDDFPRHVTLEVSVSPEGAAKDLVAANNFAYYTFDVAGSMSASVEVFADGVRLMDGDFISSNPRLLVRLPRSDFVLQRRVELLINGKEGNNRVTRSANQHAAVGSEPGDLEFTPALSDGSHELQFRVIEASPYGGLDTLRTSYAVSVQHALQIIRPLNYPNPFRDDTYFTFILTGSQIPEELRITVYTVAGRRIRELIVPTGTFQLGFNKIHWDGRDDDGDEIANGYYFYKILVRGSGRTETAIEKLARIR